MQKVKINDIEYNIPTSWDDINFGQYCEVFYDLDNNPDNLDNINIKNEIKVLSRLIGINEDDILNAPVDFYNKLRDLVKFIYERESFYYQDIDNSIEIDGVEYRIPSNEELSLRQHIDVDITTNEPSSPTKFIELLAIMLIPIGKSYVDAVGDREQLMEKIKKLPCPKCFRLLGFFLLKENLLKEITTTYTQVQDQVNQLVNNMETSSEIGIGNIS